MSKSDKKRPKYNLSEVFEALESKEAENLRCLYNEYSERMRHSGTQIWHIGTIFIPLSLSGIVLNFKTPHQALLVATFSILLIWIWYFISFVIRTALDRDYAICAAIETSMLNLKNQFSKRGLGELIEKRQKVKGIYLSLHRIRLIIPIFITLGWLIVVIISRLS